MIKQTKLSIQDVTKNKKKNFKNEEHHKSNKIIAFENKKRVELINKTK